MGGSLLQLLTVFTSGVFAQVIIPRGPGESLTVRCEYGAEYWWSSKTWCRETDQGRCDRILTTAVTGSTSVTHTSGRTKIWDQKTIRVISVTVQDLREEDSGRYWCGVYFSDENKVLRLKTPELQVSRGLHAQVIPRGPGESLRVQCEYPDTYRNNGKTWCRERGDVCDLIVRAPDRTSSGRTTIWDNKTLQLISVTFENLQVLDSGEYWCAANVGNNFKITNRFQLQVSEVLRNTATTAPNVSTEHTQGQDARGNPETTNTSSLSDLKIILIAVALGILLLLTIIALVFVIRIRGRRKQRIMGGSNKRMSPEPVASTNARSSEVDPAAGPGELDSQEVKYATLTLHGSRDQRDATYSNVGFHRRPAASNDTPESVEYASINLQPR
ncbi:CMRF35-like molecule 1 [Ambystoma mexicanum]|uniref:CMRF35-like molecule 1 n=1 Tax=Ambystoma mexicanum TaxID=8296 RepID=UPI0037E77B94